MTPQSFYDWVISWVTQIERLIPVIVVLVAMLVTAYNRIQTELKTLNRKVDDTHKAVVNGNGKHEMDNHISGSASISTSPSGDIQQQSTQRS